MVERGDIGKAVTMSDDTGATMRAISQNTPGGPEVLQETRVARPTPGANEILVAVRAAGINPTDWKHRASGLSDRFPLVLGWDVSGVVEDVAYGVTIFQPGDEVFGMLPYPHGVGSHAEYAVGPARSFARKPAGIDHVQAGALPLAALTAQQMLVDTARIRAGQRVLVHAAAGGVGHLAVQIAKAHGAHVIGTASTPKHDLLRELGADEVIDYREADFTEATGDIDVVLDPLAGEVAARSLKVMRPGGTLISLVPLREDVVEQAAQRGIRATVMLVEADHAGMNAVADLVEKGALRAHVEAVFPLAEAARAHTLSETGRTTGKIVLSMADGAD